MQESKKRFGDRRDGALIRDLDSMHFILPLVYPHRTDNEAYISERIALEHINAYLKEKNAVETDFPYTLFHIIVAALLKTATLRPKLNRFIANKNLYQRNELSAAFVVKKQFDDDADEAFAFVRATPEDTLDSIHEKIRKQVMVGRSSTADSTTDTMDMFMKLPRFIVKIVIRFLRFLDRHGWVPSSFIETDPSYSSLFLTNLGSIKLRCGYHHLANWGTNSVFCVIGEKKMTPFYDADGVVTMRETLDLGLTIDERIADGYYYSKTIRLLKRLVESPELLDRPLSEEVEY